MIFSKNEGIIKKLLVSNTCTLPTDSSGQSNKNLKINTIVFSVLITIIGIIVGPSLIEWLFPEFVEAISIIQIIIIVVIPRTIKS